MHHIHRPTEPKEGRGAHRGEMVSFGKRKAAGTGYLARSERVGPCVLVLHDFFGLTSAVTEVCDRLNEEGFTALAPDLYGGRIARDVEEAEAFAAALDREEVLGRLLASCDHLTSNWHPRLGLLGFSLGASLACETAAGADPEGAVLYYGYGDLGPERWSGPLLVHLAELDEWEPLEEARADLDRFTNHGGDAEVHVYELAGHWFANPTVPDAYDPDVAGLAWAKTVDFLRHHVA